MNKFFYNQSLISFIWAIIFSKEFEPSEIKLILWFLVRYFSKRIGRTTRKWTIQYDPVADSFFLTWEEIQKKQPIQAGIRLIQGQKFGYVEYLEEWDVFDDEYYSNHVEKV